MDAGAEVRIRRVAELAPPEAVAANPDWQRHVDEVTSAMNPHGGLESTILALNNAFYHWGCAVVPPGYTDPKLFEAGGNPYGTSFASGGSDGGVSQPALAAARIQGRRLAEFAHPLAPLRQGTDVPAEQAEEYERT